MTSSEVHARRAAATASPTSQGRAWPRAPPLCQESQRITRATMHHPARDRPTEQLTKWTSRPCLGRFSGLPEDSRRMWTCMGVVRVHRRLAGVVGAGLIVGAEVPERQVDLPVPDAPDTTSSRVVVEPRRPQRPGHLSVPRTSLLRHDSRGSSTSRAHSSSAVPVPQHRSSQWKVSAPRDSRSVIRSMTSTPSSRPYPLDPVSPRSRFMVQFATTEERSSAPLSSNRTMIHFIATTPRGPAR